MVMKSFLHQNPPEKEEGDGSKSSSGWRDRYKEFMERGPCKKAYMDLQDMMTFPEKSVAECSRNMEMCMEANADYYHPLSEANKAINEQLRERMMKDLVHSNIPVNEVNDEEADKKIFARIWEKDKNFARIWEKACCKESLMKYAVNCRDEGDLFQLSSQKKNNKEEVSCHELLTRFSNCIDAHPDHPFFAIKKSTVEHMEKEYQALFSGPSRS